MKTVRDRKLTILTACTMLLLSLAGFLFWMHTAIAGTAVGVSLGRVGLSSLKYRGQELLSRGDFRVERVVMEDQSGALFEADLTATIRTDAKRGEVNRIYSWGSV